MYESSFSSQLSQLLSCVRMIDLSVQLLIELLPVKLIAAIPVRVPSLITKITRSRPSATGSIRVVTVALV